MLTIVTAPNIVLSQKAKTIPQVSEQIRSLIEEMTITLAHTHDPEGVGLAAPQVGKSVQLFIMKPTPKAKVTVCINPKIVSHQDSDLSSSLQTVSSPLPKALPAGRQGETKGEGKNEKDKPKRKHKSVKLEGCLSLPTIWGIVKRYHEVTVSYLDEKGKSHTKTFTGFEATIVQHEIDHLQGILFPKRTLEQGEKLYKSSKNEKGEDEFEEIEI